MGVGVDKKGRYGRGREGLPTESTDKQRDINKRERNTKVRIRKI